MSDDFNKVVVVINSCKTSRQNIVAHAYLQQYLKQRKREVQSLLNSGRWGSFGGSLDMQKKLDQDSEILHHLLDENLFQCIDNEAAWRMTK